MDTALTIQADRVRRHTSSPAAERIDRDTRTQVLAVAHDSDAALSARVAELEREWDVERTLEMNASTLALTGAILGTTVNPRWFGLTAVVLTFLAQHATSGWCPPLPVLRRWGVRTQNEIDREKYALKAIRGDLGTDSLERPSVDAALAAVTTTESDRAGERDPDRVRRYTSARQLARIDDEMERRVRLYAEQSHAMLTERIAELEQEWSVERYLQLNVAAVGLTSMALALTANRKWGAVTCAGLAFFMFHAVEGFDPPLPALRRLGIRSRAEINRERYALKILRGDFDGVIARPDHEGRITAALEAVGI